MIKDIFALLKKEFLLESKQKNNLTSMLLFSTTILFLLYFLFSDNIEIKTWNALFWITSVFSVTSAFTRSFAGESGYRHLYWYTLVHPKALIISKIIFNIILMVALTAINLMAFMIVFSKFPENVLWFGISSVLGVVGLSIIMTFISALVFRSQNNFMLMVVLGFPVLIPLMLSVIRASEYFLINGVVNFSVLTYIGIIVFLIIITLLLSLILFPYLWRE